MRAHGAGRPAPVTWVFDTRPDEVRRALGLVGAYLVDHGVAAERRSEAELVLAEVLNNVVEHAYREQPGGWIELSLSLDGQRAQVRLRDGGLPMPGLELPRGNPPDPIALPEGGFGWFLIHTLTEGLFYCRVGNENRLGFDLPLN